MAEPAPRWSADEDVELTRLHGQGMSLSDAARAMARSKASLSRAGARLGLTWDTSLTEKATRAKIVDAKARRVTIIARMYDEVEALLTDLEAGRAGQGWKTIMKGAYGAESVESLNFVPTRDRREIADTLSRYTDRAVRLEQIDAGGAEHVRSLLSGLADQLGLTDREPA